MTKTVDYDYHLPPDLIAQHPAQRRDGSRMMVVHRKGETIEHRQFSDFPDFLSAGDLLVLNNTRVIPARIFGKKTGSGGRVEFLMLEEIAPGTWEVLMRCRRRPDVGGVVELPEGRAILLEEGEMGRAKIRIESALPVLELLEKYGEPPLPPYIQRVSGVECRGEEDKNRYQTIYAREPGAVAAPTAGLHFTPEVFERVRAKGVERAEVTLHVGIGTFRPVTADQLEDHTMEAERYEIGPGTVRKLDEVKGRVMAVGSTAVRTLETFAAGFPTVGRSSLFIYPPYEFEIVDAMLTNFHLPKSTLLMMVSALAGRDLIRRAYEEAIREKYRFFSYGDCMLIL